MLCKKCLCECERESICEREWFGIVVRFAQISFASSSSSAWGGASGGCLRFILRMLKFYPKGASGGCLRFILRMLKIYPKDA